jgi:hypothetical protein
MINVISTGRKLATGLMLLLFAGSLMAASTIPATYVKPDLDLTKYKKVKVKPLDISNAEVLKPSWEQGTTEEWTFEEGVGEEIQKLFMDAMHEQLEHVGGYPIVTESGPDVLRVEVEVLSITPYTKPGSKSGDEGHQIETLGSGDLVISAEFRDSQTRELLILVEGERAIGDEYRTLSPENHIDNLKGLFSAWGVKIAAAMSEGR